MIFPAIAEQRADIEPIAKIGPCPLEDGSREDGDGLLACGTT
jgi:hypothetical protein